MLPGTTVVVVVFGTYRTSATRLYLPVCLLAVLVVSFSTRTFFELRAMGRVRERTIF